ncbi:MAG TPA: hypothetical protein VGB73_00505 [Pyrinomonadaceae bacterium]|jgi:tetratricopeptide (TPR) repeat protein
MKAHIFSLKSFLAAFACAVVASTVLTFGAGVPSGFAALATAAAQDSDKDKDKSKEKAPKVSEGERKAAQKINDAKDAAAKFQAASEFIKKYPQSTLRPQVVGLIATQIQGVQDVGQRISLAESFMNTFTEASDANLMYPVLVESYIASKRVEDAFNAGSSWLESNPNEVGALYLLSVTGADEARRNNPKFLQQSQQYGLKAIQLIEADQRPPSMDAETWTKNKSVWLPQLYQSMGFISMLGGSTTEALTRLQKASTLNPTDPFNYVLIGSIKNQDYEQMAKLYKLMPDGAEKTQLLDKINTRLDEIIDAYAHAVATAQGRAEYKQLHDQLLGDLQNYYKFRHKSSDGLQKLIDKYKPTTATTTTPSTPQ